jgi:hypothetical protein
MAVVQISRIQVRRGQKNAGSGIPQLASGELGWAVDARELYIGNGAVSEGAPAVGNTKVLTQYDNLFDLADTYSYRSDDAWMNTGGDSGVNYKRTLQARLDDRVSVKAFGATGETTQIATSYIQNAIDQLYINDANKGSISSRVELFFEAGEYIIDDTIYIPPQATLIGAGADKTVIRSNTVNKPLFKTVNSSSTVGNPASHASTTTLNQPTNITMKGFTLHTTVDNKALVLDSCKNSIFEDIKVMGNWESGNAISNDQIGIELNNLSSSVETKNNSFTNCSFSNFSYGVQSDWDIHNVNWKDCEFCDNGYGVGFGTGLTSLDITPGSGKEKGPNQNVIESCYFHDIDRQAIWMKFGVKNSSINNKFDLCGNNGSAEHVPSYSVIKFEQVSNISNNDIFGRTSVLSYDSSYWDSVKYVPEIEGAVDATFGQVHVLNTISRTGTDANGIIHQKRFRLPAEDEIANQRYDIEYLVTSRNYTAFRSGTLTININGIDKTLSLSDNQNYTGTTAYEDDISFDALIQDADGDTIDDTLDIRIGSSMPSDDVSQIEFKVNLRKTIVDATGE